MTTIRPYPDPCNPGYLTNGKPLPERYNRPADRPEPEWHVCEVCGRRRQFYEGYIEHLDGHRVGELARRINRQLFGDAPAPPALPEGFHLE